MKKIKLDGKLNLNKTTISELNDEQLKNVNGGGFLSIGKKCSKNVKCQCDSIDGYSKGLFCRR